MFTSRLGFLALVMLTTVRIGIADAESPSPDASGPAPMTLAQADAAATATASTRPLTCCFGGTESGACTQSSPNLPGCEFVMAYNCGKAGYSCDAEKGVCSCNADLAASGQSQPSQ